MSSVLAATQELKGLKVHDLIKLLQPTKREVLPVFGHIRAASVGMFMWSLVAHLLAKA